MHLNHAVGNTFFLVSNIVPNGNKIKHYLQNMAPVIALKPDDIDAVG